MAATFALEIVGKTQAFSAPPDGGWTSNLGVPRCGALFDKQDPEAPPLFDPVTTDIDGDRALFGHVIGSS